MISAHLQKTFDEKGYVRLRKSKKEFYARKIEKFKKLRSCNFYKIFIKNIKTCINKIFRHEMISSRFLLEPFSVKFNLKYYYFAIFLYL